MKKLFSLLATAVLVLNGAVSSSVAREPFVSSPKPGAACKQLGKVQTTGKNSFTCIKSGKKLVWSKPRTAVTVKPAPKPAPTPTPLARPSLDNLVPEAVYLYSRSEINSAVERNPAPTVVPTFHIGKNVPEQIASVIKGDLERAFKLWSPTITQSDTVHILWYVSGDLDWAAAKYVELTGHPVEWSNINSNCKPTYCGNATATKSRNGSLVFEQGMKHGSNQWNRANSAHEYTHLAQIKLSNAKLQSMPLWIVEGGAQFYGEALGYAPIDPDLSMRRGMHGQFSKDSELVVSKVFPGRTLREIMRTGNTEDIVKLMKLVEFDGYADGRGSLAYLMGAYATEVLISVFGHEKFVQLYQAFQTSTNWEANFQTVYGISPSAFYEKLSVYLKQMSREF